MLETNRLILRPWQDSDAEALYRYGSSPDVGPNAGWPAHTSVENSLEIIQSVLSQPETYAVVPKTVGHAVGSVGLMVGSVSHLMLPEEEGEIGCWIGVPFWGQGLIPEAVRELLRRGFEDLGLRKLWYGYFDGNLRSKRVMEKCGFVYQYTKEGVCCFMMDEARTEHIGCLTKAEWERNSGCTGRADAV